MKIAVVCVLVCAFLALSQAMPVEDIQSNVAHIENELVNTFCGPTTNDQSGAETAAQKTSGRDAKAKGKKNGGGGGKKGQGKGQGKGGKTTTEASE